MTAPLTTEERDELERLAKAATPGPWQRSGVRQTITENCIMVGSDAFLIVAIPWGKHPKDHAGAFADAAYIAAANPSAVLRLIAQARAPSGVPTREAELEQERAALTKALTGLTCGGSEFFIRKGDRYTADINACVEWVRRRDRDAFDCSVKAIRERNEAVAALKLPSPPVEGTLPVAPDRVLREIERVAEVVSEGDGFWRSCSGCYETNEGYPTAPTDPVFKCARGNGCSECGGLGAIWDTTDYGAMANDMIADELRREAAKPCETAGNEDVEPGCCGPCRAREVLAQTGGEQS